MQQFAFKYTVGITWLSLYLAVNTGIPFCDTFMTDVGGESHIATPVVCLPW